MNCVHCVLNCSRRFFFYVGIWKNLKKKPGSLYELEQTPSYGWTNRTFQNRLWNRSLLFYKTLAEPTQICALMLVNPNIVELIMGFHSTKAFYSTIEIWRMDFTIHFAVPIPNSFPFFYLFNSRQSLRLWLPFELDVRSTQSHQKHRFTPFPWQDGLQIGQTAIRPDQAFPFQ